MASTSSSIMDLLEAECPDIAGRRKRRRRRNKHVNPSTQRNLVKPPPPPPKCTFRQPSLIDPDGWVVLVRCDDDETLHEFDEKLPLIAAKAGINEAILRSHGFLRLVYVLEEEDKKARDLVQLLEPYSAVFVGRTHQPFVRERTLQVHDLPAGIGYNELTDALDCQFPGKSLSFDVLITEDPRREPEREVLIVTHDAGMCHQMLNNGGLKLFDERLTFRCSERSSEAAAAANKWKKKKSKVVPEAERQCFKCLGFGHMAEGCVFPPRCKRCAGPHTHRECPGAAVDDVVCVNCGARDHRAVSRSCPVRPGSAQKKRKEPPSKAAAGGQGPPARGSPSPSPSPSDTGADDSLGAASCSSCPEGARARRQEEKTAAGEEVGREAEGKGPSPSGEHTAPESRSEDDAEEDFAAEASTEELRDSSDMASPAATASPRDDAAPPDFTPSGVSSTTGEGKQAEDEQKDARAEDESDDAESETKVKKEQPEKQAPGDGDAKGDGTEGADDVNSSNIEEGDPDKEKRVCTSDESEEEGERLHDADGVLYFTASAEGGDSGGEGDADAEDALHCKTASAVASFFSDLFGAAEAPSKPLDYRFVATLRSLQESVYADIVSRHPRRGPSSPRERKPAKKRRLAGPAGASREAHTQTAGARSPPPSPTAPAVPTKALRSPLGRLRAAALADGAAKASRGLAERRLRVLEQFLQVVNAILEIE